MSKHTAGPWKFKRVNNAALAKNSSVNLLTNGEGFNLGLLSTWRDSPESEMEAEANARLIAAAPDLLEALERLKCELILSDVDMDYIESHFRPWLNKAEAAIDKARGEA